ncbi:MAG: C39 family peptidase [Verrucomicrobiae bacterium]|nr:C39 family peptidase [Verrucomicrobiae bacterium]
MNHSGNLGQPYPPAFQIISQPSATSCGPACLHSIYTWYGLESDLQDIIDKTPTVKGGGTLAVNLGLHALSRGFKTVLYSCNLRVLDPSWFPGKRKFLVAKLAASREVRSGNKEKAELASLEQYVNQGGKLTMTALTRSLLRKHLRKGEPLLTGLSATFLYGHPREIPETGENDDLRGESEGHFVILHGFDRANNTVTVHDPYPHSPFGEELHYPVHIDRLLNAILLGVLTHDANILVLRKKSQ